MFGRKLSGYCAVAALYSGDLMAANIHLDISQIEVLNGKILVALYNSKEDYERSAAPFREAEILANAETVSTQFTDLAPGEYVIQLYHDENDNGELDSNFIGLPTEGYGFSNNGGKFGPPSYEEAKFSVVDDTQVSIKLR